MKKLSFLIASIVVLLTVGIFTSQAVSYNAGNFTNLNFDFGRYVEDDVYKYKCNKTNYTCSKVKVSSLSAGTSSDLYDTESECKSKCKAIAVDKSYTEYTGGISTDWWTSDDDEDDYTKEDSWSYTEKTNDGLSGWDFTFGGNDKEDKGNKTNLNEFSDPSNSLGFDLFSWGDDVKKDGITSLKTDVVTNPFTSGFDFTAGDDVDSSGTKQTTNIFTNILESLGFKEKEIGFDSTVIDDKDLPETDEEEDDNNEGDITFSANPSKTYTKGESIKITIKNKPKVPKNHEFYFWYDLKVDWKDTIDDDSDDLLKEANAINTDSFEIPTKDYYKIEITLKASTKGPYPKYEYKEYTSETVVLTLDKQENKDIDGITNDCYLEITKLNPNTNRLTSENAKDVEVTFRLKCTKDKIDVKPLSVSAYIDVPGLYTIDKDIFQCDTQKFDGKSIYKEGTEYTVTCPEEVVAAALEKQGDNDTRTRYLMVDMYYKTNKKTGHNYGEEYTARFTSTRNKVIGTATGDGGGNQNDRNMEIEATVNPGDNRTFKNCDGGKVTIKWSSNGYDECEISSEKLLYIQGEGKEGSKEFSIYKNASEEPAHYTIKLECSYSEGEKTKTDEKSVQINVPKCEGSEPPQDGEETIKEKCDKNKCSTTYGLGKQIILRQVNDKIVNASKLKFNVKIGEDTCDLDVFQKTFARILVDGKIIQDITIPNTKEREFTFGNIWEQLSETTRNNISDTLIKYNYDGAAVNFTLESWGTFDDTKGKAWNCNWNREAQKVVFVLDKTNDNTGTKPKTTDTTSETNGTESKTDTSQEIFKLRASKINLEVGEKYKYDLEGNLPKDAKDVKCDFISKVEGAEYILKDLNQTSFESLKKIIERDGWTWEFPGKASNQVRCQDKDGNKYYSNWIEFNITKKEENNAQKNITNSAIINFKCIGCEQCDKLIAMPTFSVNRDPGPTKDNKNRENNITEYTYNKNDNYYSIVIPVDKVRRWTLKFPNCAPERGNIFFIQNDDNKWWSGRDNPSWIASKLIDIKSGDNIDLGTVEIEIKK